ncbi:MAG TPA: hypothetical protein DDZ81_01850 [Acetobacteraceae bacterium]|jgi:porin|nr:hypothetical protein [Acetobacteraceae bacterium]
MNKMRYSLGLSTAALTWALSGAWVAASAQTATPPAQPAEAAQPAQGPMGVYDSIVSFGQSLAQKGVFLSLDLHENVGALLAGGVKTGVAPVDQISGAAVFDLQTILGIQGASFHIGFDQRGGAGQPQGLGGPGGIAGTSALLQYDAESLRIGLSDFYWEQGFDNDRLDIIAGRTQPTTDFMFNDLSCAFVSSIMCAQPGTFYLSQNSSPYGYAQWGGRVNFQITPQVYIRAGMYNENPSQTGFNYSGLNWNTENSVGVFAPIQIGYKTTFANATYPSNYYIGMYNDSSSYTKPNGQIAYGRQGYWAWAEQTLWRPNRDTKQSLTAFASVLVYGQGTPFWGQYTAGLWDRAPFGAVRPDDAIGVMASLYKHNESQAASEGYATARSDQWALEADYSATVVPGIIVEPYVQYVINPDNPISQPNYSSGSFTLKNDFIVGVQFIVELGKVFQFPQFDAH